MMKLSIPFFLFSSVCGVVLALHLDKNRGQIVLGDESIEDTSISSGIENSVNHTDAQATSPWFLPNIDHTSDPVRGYVPFLWDKQGNPVYNYPVYIAVRSGDSQGFVDAVYSHGPQGNRDNCWLAGQPRVIYLAPGTYTLSSTLFINTDTVIIGDAVNPPVIKASTAFSGEALISGGADKADQCDQNHRDDRGGELHFSVSIRNVILDTTATPNGNFIALRWRTAQNSALNNVQINMPQGKHTGIVVGQGSLISVGDVRFSYGAVGLSYSGSQQAQLKNLQFTFCTIGISIDGGNAINILAPKCDTVGRCIVYNSGEPWVSVIDGVSKNSGDFFTSNNPFPNFMLENISKDTTNTNMITIGGNVVVGGVTSIGTYIYGNTYGKDPVYQTHPNTVSVNRPSVLAPGGKYPIVAAPQYADKTINDVINLKDASKNGGYTLKGDGGSDDTAALQGAINTAAAQGKIAYLPFGIYKVTSTITIPPGSHIYGEAWSTISGYGSVFGNVNDPKPIVRVGVPGSKGVAVIQDLRFSVGEALPGAIILQVNMAGERPGDVGIFNSLITVGGTRDTALSCWSEANCIGAHTGLHLAPGSSAYVDNFWSWVADHQADISSTGTNSASKGGILVESQAGTWLVGVGSEHWWLYNLGYHNAQNVFIGMFQSETNYRQGPRTQIIPPAPFVATSSDPDFSWCGGGDVSCRMTVAEYYSGSCSDIWHYAAGSYSFAQDSQNHDVQQRNMYVINNPINNAHLHGYTDHNADYLFRLPNGNQFGLPDKYSGAWGSLVADVAQQY